MIVTTKSYTDNLRENMIEIISRGDIQLNFKDSLRCFVEKNKTFANSLMEPSRTLNVNYYDEFDLPKLVDLEHHHTTNLIWIT